MAALYYFDFMHHAAVHFCTDGDKSAALSVTRAEDVKFLIVISVISQVVAWFSF